MTRKNSKKKVSAQTARGILASSPGFHMAIFPHGLFMVLLDGLSKRDTTRSLEQTNLYRKVYTHQFSWPVAHFDIWEVTMLLSFSEHLQAKTKFQINMIMEAGLEL